MIVIDGKDHVLGRIGTVAAKKALMGEEIVILNSGQILVTGRKSEVLARYKANRDRGIPTKGPVYSRRADLFVKRAIRGMLPYKKGRGSDAFKRIKCYVGVPDQFKDQKPITLKGAHVSKIPNLKYLQVQEICRHLGGKS